MDFTIFEFVKQVRSEIDNGLRKAFSKPKTSPPQAIPETAIIKTETTPPQATPEQAIVWETELGQDSPKARLWPRIARVLLLVLGGLALAVFHCWIPLALEPNDLSILSFLRALGADILYAVIVIWLLHWPEMRSYKAASLALGGSILTVIFIVIFWVAIFAGWHPPFHFNTDYSYPNLRDGLDWLYILFLQISLSLTALVLSIIGIAWNIAIVRQKVKHNTAVRRRARQGIWLSIAAAGISGFALISGFCTGLFIAFALP